MLQRGRGQGSNGLSRRDQPSDGTPGIDEGPNVTKERADESDADPPDHPDGDRQQVAVPIALIAEEASHEQQNERTHGKQAQRAFHEHRGLRRQGEAQRRDPALPARAGRTQRRQRRARPPRPRRSGNATAAGAGHSAGRMREHSHLMAGEAGCLREGSARSLRVNLDIQDRPCAVLAHHVSRRESAPRSGR